MPPRLISINLKGFKCFRDFSARLEPLEVFVGANGSGKTSLFEFLGFLRDAATKPIPPEVVKGAAGQEVFRFGESSFSWKLVQNADGCELTYTGEIIGPKGKVTTGGEEIWCYHKVFHNSEQESEKIFESDRNKYTMRKSETMRKMARKPKQGNSRPMFIGTKNRLTLGFHTIREEYEELYAFSRFIKNLGVVSSFKINRDKIRRTILVQQDPELEDNFGNLSSILFSLSTDHAELFNELKRNLKLVVPGFEDIKVKARGGPGEVIAFWREQGGDELTLADLSDGILNLLCWFTLCLLPEPPSLVCIDEPELGVHPRALPLLAGLFQKLSERTQVLIATHSSYLLAQFPVENITVMKKEAGEVVAKKVQDSKTLIASLEEFGPEELEAMHQSDELEALS